jgi:haloalkane dehalogenase
LAAVAVGYRRGVEVYRTPDERFAELPDFPYEPHYGEWEGVRLAYIDEGGDGPPVVMLHGEPTWSFLWRKVMRPLLDAGRRCVVPDLPGFGRSDKPVDDAWYSYDRHTHAVAWLFDELDLRDATLVMQDWGGPIGLRIATLERPERVARLVAMDTGVFTGHQEMSEGWKRFAAFVARTPDLPIGRLIAGGCSQPPRDAVIAAYEAPFPDERSKAGARAFPALIPQAPDTPGAAEGRAVAQALLGDRRPSLLMWADSDPALPLEPVGRQVKALFPTADELTVIEEAGHFLQEDQGDQVGALIADWLATQARRGG